MVGVAIGMAALAGGAHAAAPAWKLLAATGPTNVPPTQSEIQRVTVEAEGGTFNIGSETALGEGQFTVHIANAETTTGSALAKVHATAETFSVGEHVSSSSFPSGTTILAISGSASEPVLELSAPASKTKASVVIRVSTNVVTGVTTSLGAFHVGDKLISEAFFGEEAEVIAVGPGTVTLSGFPISGGQFPIVGSEESGPIAFDAEAAALQAALEALPAFAGDTVSVTGGPGGVTDHPFFVAFSGVYADRDVPVLTVDGSNLTGASPAGHVLTVVPGGAGTGEIGDYAGQRRLAADERQGRSSGRAVADGSGHGRSGEAHG